jgi:hypothetical protein
MGDGEYDRARPAGSTSATLDCTSMSSLRAIIECNGFLFLEQPGFCMRFAPRRKQEM